MKDDYVKFCMRCGWNDEDYGCTSPVGTEVYQCPMYMHYHPDKVAEFNKAVEEYIANDVRVTKEALEIINEMR